MWIPHLAYHEGEDQNFENGERLRIRIIEILSYKFNSLNSFMGMV